MTEQEKLIWAAGFMDGEAMANGSWERPNFRPEISAAQVHRAPLDVLVELFGGRVLWTIGGGGHWYWRVYCKKAIPVIQRLLPYLIAKRAQAELVIEFDSLIHERGKSIKYVPVEEVERRKRIFLALKEINKRRTRHAERLSEEAPPKTEDGAIVRTHGNENRESQEEIPGRLQ